MNKFFWQLLIAFLTGFIVCGIAQAQSNPSTTNSQNANVRNTQITESNHKAQEWGLQPEEWERYQELMDGQLGIYSPGLDPLTALGISARNDEERRYYAGKQVMAEMQRVERELAYQKAYDEAFQQMFPGLMPVNFSASSSPAPAVSIPSGDGRLAVFVREDCKPCEVKVQQMQNAGLAFDLYMIDSRQDDTLIRRWATRIGIDAQKVLSRTITLNHDAGRWQALGVNGELPAVVLEVNGKWQRQ